MGFYGKIFENLGNYFNKMTFTNMSNNYSPTPNDDGVTINLSDQFIITEQGIRINGELFNNIKTFSGERPSAPTTNTIYINTDTNIMQYYHQGAWYNVLTNVTVSGEIEGTTLKINLGG